MANRIPDLDADQWAALEPEFDRLIELDPAARLVALRQLDRPDSDRYQQLQLLLKAYAHSNAVFEGGVEPIARALFDTASTVRDPERADSLLGRLVGSYRLNAKIGTGGNAVVYQGYRQQGQFEQIVAVKVLPGWLETELMADRFRQEQQVLASLSHPNISRLLDGGISDDGHLYIVMELVEGRSITDYCQHHRLNTDAKLQLLQQVASALSYAHQNLLIHRDVKPSNILVTDDGQIKLLDFGIAKLLAQDIEAQLTSTGARPLTPAYAAPEQIRGQATTVATDIYQLGLVAYELLCQQPPFVDHEQSIYLLSKAICETEPKPPSQVASPYSDKHGDNRVGKDLDAIVLKALSKHPQQRYESMDALIAEWDRYRQHRPVEAYQPSWHYGWRKFVQRHRWSVLAGGLGLILLTTSAINSSLQSQRLRVALNQLETESATSASVATLLLDVFRQADPAVARGHEPTVRQLLEQGRKRVEHQLADTPLVRIQLQATLAEIYESLGAYAESIELNESILNAQQTLLADDPLARASTLTRLGELHSKTIDLPSAVNRLEQAIAIYQDHSPISIEHAEAINVLGWVYFLQLQPELAETQVRQAIAMLHSDQLPLHHELAVAYNNLAQVRARQGDGVEATELLRQALATYGGLVGEDHWRYSLMQRNLANQLGSQQQLNEAHALMQQALTTQLAQLGDYHPETVTTRSTLGTLQHRMGRFDQAEFNLRRTLAIQQSDSNHPDIFQMLTARRLGALLNVVGRYEEAQTIFEQLLKIHDLEEPKDLRLVAYAHVQLGIAKHGQHLSSQWRSEFDQALSLIPATEYYASITQVEYARLLLREGEPLEALDLAQQALRIRSSKLPEQHVDLARARAIVGASLVALSRLDEAAPLLVDAERILTGYWPCCDDYAGLMRRAMAVPPSTLVNGLSSSSSNNGPTK